MFPLAQSGIHLATGVWAFDEQFRNSSFTSLQLYEKHDCIGTNHVKQVRFDMFEAKKIVSKSCLLTFFWFILVFLCRWNEPKQPWKLTSTPKDTFQTEKVLINFVDLHFLSVPECQRLLHGVYLSFQKSSSTIKTLFFPTLCILRKFNSKMSEVLIKSTLLLCASHGAICTFCKSPHSQKNNMFVTAVCSHLWHQRRAEPAVVSGLGNLWKGNLGLSQCLRSTAYPLHDSVVCLVSNVGAESTVHAQR